MDEKNRNNLLNMQLYIDYIKAIENPDKIGWNGKVWTSPLYKGYDKNQRGYGIDVVKNDSAKRLTQNRPGQWLTEGEADKLMKEHILYVYDAAQKHIVGFDDLSNKRKAALLGMLYRGDSVNKNKHIININEPDDNKFFESISNYYKSKGLHERAKNSSNFFSQYQTNFLIPMQWEQWKPLMKFKQGSKMNILELLKNGSGIHIKKKNRGKFTSYCGGKVTDECIRKAKASGNPTLVKRATFAANARKWKHKEGGKAFVSGVSILDSNPGAYKEVKKRLKKHLFGGDITFLNNYSNRNNYSNSNAFGGAFMAMLLGKLRDYELQQYEKKLKEQQLIIDAQLELLKNDTVSNLLGTAVNKGLDLGMNYLSNKFGNKALNKNGTPSTIQPKLTTNTWKPSTSLFTPSLGTGTQGSMLDFSYMLNPNYNV